MDALYSEEEVKVPGGKESSDCQTPDECLLHSRLEKVEGSGCGGDGKALKMFEQKYDMVWTTWAFELVS